MPCGMPGHAICLSMTRKQVAARLGRSDLATVRRLEGIHLHPVVDPSGVHRFNPREVDALARGIEKPGGLRNLKLAEITSPEPESYGVCIGCARLHDRLKQLEAELSSVTRAHVAELNAVRDSCRIALAKNEGEQRELESALAELLEALDE